MHLGGKEMYAEFWCGNLSENWPLVRPRCTKEDVIKMDLEEMGWEGVDWMHLIRDGDMWGGGDLVNTVVNIWVLQNAGRFLTSWKTTSFSRSTMFHGVSCTINCV